MDYFFSCKWKCRKMNDEKKMKKHDFVAEGCSQVAHKFIFAYLRPYDAIFSRSFFMTRQIKRNKRVSAYSSKSKPR